MTKVWVTRDEPPDGRLCRLLEDRGIGAIHAPLVRIDPISDGREDVVGLGSEDWLVLTSPRAVDLITDEVARIRPRIAVAGRVSEAAARARGFRVDFVSPTESGAGIWDFLDREAGEGRVCFARSRRADLPADPPSGLRVVDLYDVREVVVPNSRIDSAHAATFTSRSAVESCVKGFGGVPVPAFSIGPSTTKSLNGVGARVLGEARSRSLESLADLVHRWSRDRDA